MKKPELTKKGQFFDYSTLIIVFVLLAFGLVMIYSTSSYSAAATYGDSAFYFKKQLMATLLGLAAMMIMSFVPYQKIYRFAVPVYAITILTVFLIKTGLGLDVKGATRWVKIGPLSFQPAEAVKLGTIIILAAFASFSGKYMAKTRQNIFFLIIALIPALLLFVITNNLSSAIIVVGIAYIMLIVSNPRPKWIYVVSIIGVVAVTALLVYVFNNLDPTSDSNFRFKRLFAWRDPEHFASETGYQTIQAMYAIGSGGFFGKGLGNSIQKLGFIPEAHNDMIFSIVCEELGLFGAICIIILFILLIYRFMVVANTAPDLFGSLLVVGVLAHIGIQVILNIAVVTNTIPNTGISLPFISYGGTSVCFLLVEIGIVLNVSRQIRVPVYTTNNRRGE